MLYPSDSDDSDDQAFFLHNAAEIGDLELLAGLLVKPDADAVAGELGLPAPLPMRPRLPDVNLRDDNNCTPLHIALLAGHLEAARLLLEAGASAHKSCEGSPPLHIAVCAGGQPGREAFAAAAAALLLQHGAMPYDRDDHGRTPLHWAAFWGLEDCITGLVQAAERLRTEAAQAAAAAAAAATAAGAGAEGASGVRGGEEGLPPIWIMQDKQGNTALHLAARYRQPAAAVALLQAAAAAAAVDASPSPAGTEGDSAATGPSPAQGSPAALAKVRNKAGQTALHCAALGGCAACAAAVREAAPGLVTARDKQGLTAADLAAKRGHAALAAELGGSTAAVAAAAAVAGNSEAAQAAGGRTLLVAPPQCREHFTCPDPIVRGGPDPPPENVNRLHVLTDPGSGTLRASEFAGTVAWDEAPQQAEIGDILRMHDWAYVRKIQAVCERLPDDPSVVGHLDGDTAVSHGTFAAALAAAGAVCAAVDQLMRGEARNAFCVVRPPGHHAGPTGVVTCANDPHGSHGFCLFNNVAIGAAYAMNVYRHAGIKRVAILDFDVHHGNGTEACVTGAIPTVRTHAFSTPWSEGVQTFPVYRPWLGRHDRDNIFFASVQGYGPKMAGLDAYVYPGSGATCDTRAAPTKPPAAAAAAPAAGTAGAAATAAEGAPAAPAAPPAGPTTVSAEESAAAAAPAVAASGLEEAASGGTSAAAAQPMDVDGGEAEAAPAASAAPPATAPATDAPAAGAAGAAGAAENGKVEEDPDHEFEYHGGEQPPSQGPRIIDVGIPGPGTRVALWRRSWRDKILPALANFKPDIIFVSAGFDAHKKDDINFHYIGVTERDYEWLTDQLVQVANRCCAGRLVSVLEGGYRIQGGLVSAFARSVAAHVRALAEPHRQAWDPEDARWEREYEKRMRAEAEAKRAAAAAAERAAAKAALEAMFIVPPPSATAAAGLEGQAEPLLPADGAAAAGGGGTMATAGAADSGAQQSAAAAPSEATAAAADGGSGGGGAGAGEPEPKRRRRAAVDYVALNKQLEAEQAAKAGAPDSGAPGGA